jgi:hypothetical protein
MISTATTMTRNIHIELLVDATTARTLSDPARQELMGDLVMRMAAPWDGDDPLTGTLEGEITLRREVGRPVPGFTAGQVAWLQGRTVAGLSDEELMAPAMTPVTVADILQLVPRFWHSPGRARLWLFRRHPALGERPVDLLATNDGALAVALTILRLKAGMYS